MKPNRLTQVLLGLWVVAVVTATAARGESADRWDTRLPDELRQRAVEVMREALSESPFWVRVHAAEFLLDLSIPGGVRESFLESLGGEGDQAQVRIGHWRVLAKASRIPSKRDEFVGRIIDAAGDPQGPDRLHAIESLAKLGVAIDAETADAIAAWAATAADADAIFGQWLLARSGRGPRGESGADFSADWSAKLGSEEPIARLRAAFVLSRQASLPPPIREALTMAADQALAGSADGDLSGLADAYTVAAAWRWDISSGPDAREATRARRYEAYLADAARREPAIATVYANALADVGDGRDRERLEGWLDADDPDQRVSAAHALLRLDRRRPGAMTRFDWSIIIAYFLGMLAIGGYYSRQTVTTDDFLLGGRAMRSWAVGLSLFATLLSTLTYLAVPGEMIRHGPVIVMGLASLPLVAWVVGWLLIPRFMRLGVTSAYEILETRFGYGGRLLGSVMFLALRFFWMAVILYATTDAVIVPLLGWTSAATPWVCAVLGIITVVYSSLGGLRAVVATDVIQTGILLGGALLALVVITTRLGGVAVWWPTGWDPEWTPLRFFDPTSPRTVVMAFLATGLWYICTAGSDQMAIQRYLATKDVRAARRMFHITLLMNLLSWGLLTVLGFALLGFYRAHPEYLADGTTVATDADKLFPRFIAVGLPVGVSGLVVAGLLAAAMSSLSSGINSSCAVISVDYVGRWRRGEVSPEKRLRETRAISWSIGAIAVLLSMAASVVPGNLLDVVYRIGNLLVAPLFVLFFLALFVRRASSPATLIAVLASVAVAVSVAYGEPIGRLIAWLAPGASDIASGFETVAAMGVLWIMPLSLATGVLLGWGLSVAGLGSPAPPLPTDPTEPGRAPGDEFPGR